MKKLLGNFWFQTFALVLLTAVIGISRLILPSKEPGQISPLFFRVRLAEFLPACIAFAVICLFYILLNRWIKVRTTVRYLLIGLVFLLLSFSLTAMNGWNLWLPGVLGEYFQECKSLVTKPDLISQWSTATAASNMHITVHPPAFCLYIMLFQLVFGDQLVLLAVINIFIVGISAYFIYKVLNKAMGENGAFLLSMMYLTAGNLLLYAGTVDGLLCAIAAAALLIMIKAVKHDSIIYLVLLGVVIAFGSFFTYQFAFVFAFYFILIVILKILNMGASKTINLFKALFIPLIAYAVFYCLLYVFFGFNYIKSFTEQQQNSEDYYSAGWNIVYWIKTSFFGAPQYTGDHRSYLVWMPGNVLAYLFIIGPATAVLFLRTFFASFGGGKKQSLLRCLCLATGFGFIIIALSGLVLGETERVWLFLLPFFIVSLGAFKDLDMQVPDLRWMIMVNLLTVWLLRVLTRPLVF